MFSVSGAGDLLGIAVSLTIPSLVAALCISTNQLSPNIVTEEVKTRVVKTKYGKVQGFVSKVSWNVKMLTNQYFSDPVSEI